MTAGIQSLPQQITFNQFATLLDIDLLSLNMRWSGDVGIITGRYVSHDDSTEIELWSRARNGESVLLRVTGVEPWFEVTPNGRWEEGRDLSSQLEAIKQDKTMKPFCPTRHKIHHH